MKQLATLLVACIALVALARPAHAQNPRVDVTINVVGQKGTFSGSSSEHVLRFSGPVGIPGVSLPPGAYIFRFVGSSVVQVVSEDRSKIYGMFFVTPLDGNHLAQTYSVRLRRMPSGVPARLLAVTVPDATGFEVVYPQEEEVAPVEHVG